MSGACYYSLLASMRGGLVVWLFVFNTRPIPFRRMQESVAKLPLNYSAIYKIISRRAPADVDRIKALFAKHRSENSKYVRYNPYATGLLLELNKGKRIRLLDIEM